ncbi:MFS transporter [Arthrobacter sp. RCC_34]|uniref:MFS transporter n=1 Tax=Arthrobacter sp. RCC_34 TaxID=3239230 RepID=UPI00352448B2
MTRHQRIALVVLLTAGFTLAVDFSILNVALPVIGREVGFALENLQWIATAFSLCAAGLTLLSGRVADLLGRRRVFLTGMALLGISSLAGGIASEPALLLAARVGQGVATALVIPSALALLLAAFEEGPLREKALGLNGALMAAGFTTGAVLGGLLTDILSWRWAFFLNIPVALAVLIAGPLVLHESRPAKRQTLDVPGAITVTLGLFALVLGLTQAAETGWTSPFTLLALGAAAVLFFSFVLVERRAAAPLVPLWLVRRPAIAWGNLAGLMAFATETSLVFLLTLYLQRVLGYSPLGAGLSFAVLGLGTVLGGLLGPRAIARFDTKGALAGGFAVQAIATGILVLLRPEPGSIILLLIATFVGGVANLVVIVGFTVTATSGLPDSEQGLATGLATMSQQIGITLGIPIMSAIVTAHLAGAGAGAAGPDAILGGLSTAIIVNAGVCLAMAVLLAVFLRRPAAREQTVN